MSIVVGLDLSLTSTGVATIQGSEAITTRVTSKPPPTRPGEKPTLDQRHHRLERIVREILYCTRAADLAVVEGPSLGQARQGGQHDRAGLWWLIVNELHKHGRPVTEVPPAVVKKYATGKGGASKDTVLAAVVRRYLDVEVTGNDEADALVCAAIGARYLGHPIDNMPKVHVAALDKVRWPEEVVIP